MECVRVPGEGPACQSKPSLEADQGKIVLIVGMQKDPQLSVGLEVFWVGFQALVGPDELLAEKGRELLQIRLGQFGNRG